jgi:hypothetical protein
VWSAIGVECDQMTQGSRGEEVTNRLGDFHDQRD